LPEVRPISYLSGASEARIAVGSAAASRTIDGCLGIWLAQHYHPVADRRGELFDALEQFGMRIDWGHAKLFSGPYQILAHQPQCAIDALMIGGSPVRAFARRLQVPYLNNVTPLLI